MTKPQTSKILTGDVSVKIARIEGASCTLVISSPPYNIGKEYEPERRSLDEYHDWQRGVIKAVLPKLTEDGSICWQVGNYVSGGEFLPLDVLFIDIFRELGLRLRNRIIWRYNFGLHADKRFSGRYEMVLWATKSDDYKFNLHPVCVPQTYPGKRHSARKGEKAGIPSGNPLGKNPSDYWEFSAENDFLVNPVWEIPNVKASHPEKTEHPCQFPVELAERCILSMTLPGDLVLDPFVGTGSSLIAAQKHGRRGVGIERDASYVKIARARLDRLRKGELPLRPSGRPIRVPFPGEKVSTISTEWVVRRQQTAKAS